MHALRLLSGVCDTDADSGAGVVDVGAPSDFGPLPTRVLTQKEVASLFAVDPRHLRRIQNLDRKIEPLRRPGSLRAAGYAPEEVARLASSRVRAGKSFDRAVAQRLGYLSFLDLVTARASEEHDQGTPERFESLRIQLLIDVLVFGNASLLAKRMGITATEISGYEQLAKHTIGGLITAAPQIREAIAVQIAAGLVREAVKSRPAL